MKPLAFLTLLGVLPVVAADRDLPAASEVRLDDVNGKMQRVIAADERKATVLFFVLHDCPVANSYAPEISRIAEEYAARGVRCFVVYAEADLPAREAKQHAKDYAYRCPALIDSDHFLVSLAKATVTPEAAIFSATGDLIYRGRIDDRAVRPGLKKPEPEVRDLRTALDDLLDGRLKTPRFTKAVGCYIPQRDETAARPKALSPR